MFYHALLIIVLYNHESSTLSLCMQETPLVESGEKGKEKKGIKHTSQKCFHGSKNIQMAAMDSLVSNHVVFNCLLKLDQIEKTLVAQNKSADYQSMTWFSVKTLSSTNF